MVSRFSTLFETNETNPHCLSYYTQPINSQFYVLKDTKRWTVPKVEGRNRQIKKTEKYP